VGVSSGFFSFTSSQQPSPLRFFGIILPEGWAMPHPSFSLSYSLSKKARRLPISPIFPKRTSCMRPHCPGSTFFQSLYNIWLILDSLDPPLVEFCHSPLFQEVKCLPFEKKKAQRKKSGQTIHSASSEVLLLHLEDLTFGENHFWKL
jgi:hypothetical protein